MKKATKTFINHGNIDHPYYFVLCLNYGVLLSDLGQPDKSLMLLDKTKNFRLNFFGQINPKTSRAYKHIADVYSKIGDFENAILYADSSLFSLGLDSLNDTAYGTVESVERLFMRWSTGLKFSFKDFE